MSDYVPRHARHPDPSELPPILRGLADQVQVYADQRGHDVTWMTAAEREAYERRLTWQVRYMAAVARERQAEMPGYLDSHAGM